MESNIQQAKKYRAVAEGIDALTTKLVLTDCSLDMGVRQDREILDAFIALQNVVIDIAISYEDKVTENTLIE